MKLRDKNLYYIGGVVRDNLLGKESIDLDLTYVGNAIEFAKSIKEAEIIQENETFGTVRIKLDNEIIDIASTRSESYPIKGHLPKIEEIGCSLEKDILRRDFTINAMAQSTLSHKIIDYTGGLEDLKNKKLKILHEDSFIDDPTRIIRALKFKIRFGFELEKETLKKQNEYLKCINYDMSYKRLKKELVETFNLNNWNGFQIYVTQKIFKLLGEKEFELPLYDFSKIIREQKIKNPWIIYIGLFEDIYKLPLTKKEKQIVDNFYKIKNTSYENKYEIFRTFLQIDKETIIMCSTIFPNLVEEYFSKNLNSIHLEISGKDLLALGIKPSIKYQECFNHILMEKLKSPNIEITDEINLAKKFFNI